MFAVNYKRDIAEEILRRLSEGELLRAICAEHYDQRRADGSLKMAARKEMPTMPTVLWWVRDNTQGFAERYHSARQCGYDMIAEQTLEIADNTEPGVVTKTTDDGVETTQSDMTAHRKLRIDTRFKLLSKLKPEKYGDRLDARVTVVPATIEEWWASLTPEQRAIEKARLMEEAARETMGQIEAPATQQGEEC